MHIHKGNLAFIFIYTDDTESEAATKSKNFLSYLSIEASRRPNCRVYWSKNIDEGLEIAVNDGMDRALVVREGCVIYSWESFLNLIDSQWTPNHFLMGHILDRKEKYYELHNQCFMIDLIKFKQLGLPSYHSYDIPSKKCVQVQRSTDNFHDDYTPTSISKGVGEVAVESLYRGGLWIHLGLSAGYDMSPFDRKMRKTKDYYYTANQQDYEASKVYIEDRLENDTISFFMFNTEDLEPTPFEGPIEKMVIPASGLKPLYLLKQSGVLNPSTAGKKTHVVIYDKTHFQLEVFRKIIFEWDGKNYKDYVVNLCGHDLLKGQAWEEYDRKQFHQVFRDEQEFIHWFSEIKHCVDFEFIRANPLARNFKSKPWIPQSDEGSNTIIYLSNIFHYLPTSIDFSLNYRIQILNEFMNHLKDRGPNTWVDFCSLKKSSPVDIKVTSQTIQAKDFVESPLLPQPWEAIRNGESYSPLIRENSL